MGKDTTHLRLRVESTLLARLEKAADKNGRTLTGEITHRLNQSFNKEDMRQALEELASKIAEQVGNVVIREGGNIIIKRGGD